MSEDRYLLVSPDFAPPMVGGSLVYMQTLVQNSSLKFDILTGDNGTTEPEIIDKIHSIHRTKFIANSNNPSAFSLLTSYFYMTGFFLFYIFLRPFKIVIANPGVIGNSLIILMSLIFNKKVVVIAYGEEITVPLVGKGFKNLLKRRLLKIFYRRATGIVTVCHFCREILIKNLKVNPQNIDVIPSCLSEGKADMISYPDLSSKKVISVGRLIKRKGFDLLIEAVGRLKPAIPDLSLTIVGDGVEKEKLIKKIKNHDMNTYVEIISNATDEELRSLYAKAGLFVLANHQLDNGDTEGCPSVFSEAMAYGLPLIGGTGAGVDTAIIHNENGLIIDTLDKNELDEAILAILTDINMAKKMSYTGSLKLKRDHTPESVGLSFRKSIDRFFFKRPAEGFQKEFNVKCPSINSKYI